MFILFILSIIFLSVYNALPVNAENRTDTVLRKIAIDHIRQIVAGSPSLEEAASKLSITGEELKQILTELSIVPPFIIEEPEPVTVVDSSLLNDNNYESNHILAYDGVSPYLILVDKASYQLYLLQYENDQRTLKQTIECKTGRNHGDKIKEGDQKTPEGAFFFVNKYSRQQLLSMVGKKNAYLYGEMAFATNFPNSIDRMHGKNGGGIWLHGTDRSFENSSPNDTRGCVVTDNDDIKLLSNYIDLFNTPIVIVDSLAMSKKEDILIQRKDIMDFLEKWRSAWAEENIEKYGACYSSSFSSQRMNRKQWIARKKIIFNAYKVNQVNIDKISIFRHNSGLIITFTQNYSASNIKHQTGIKTLQVIRENGTWKILNEHFRRL